MLVLLGTGVLVAPASASPAGLFSDPVYDYANAIRETVFAETPLDNDGNGVPDSVVADIIRPREGGVRVSF